MVLSLQNYPRSIIGRLTAILFCCVVCTSCSSNQKYYSTPLVLSSDQFAYLKGSYVDPGLMLENQRYFAINIDGLPVDDPVGYVEEYFMIPAGQKKIIVQFTQSTHTATADFDIEILPGQKLQIIGRIANSNTNFLGVDVPDQVGIKIVDTDTGKEVAKEVIRPVIQTATQIYPPISRTLIRAL